MHPIVLLAAALTLGLQSHPLSTPRADAPDKQSVIDAEVAICKGYETNDVAKVREYLTDDYTLTDGKGVVTTKQDDVDDFVKHRIHYTTFANKNMKVRLYPGVAIVTGQTVVKGTAGTQPVSVEVQFTDTLVLINGHWRLAAGHVSRLRNS